MATHHEAGNSGTPAPWGEAAEGRAPKPVSERPQHDQQTHRDTHRIEPRVLNTDLAERLGPLRPRDIRQTIDANRSELEGFGGLRAVTANPGPLGGRPTTAYYLNEEQALLLVMPSRTETAKAVRAEVIREG